MSPNRRGRPKLKLPVAIHCFDLYGRYFSSDTTMTSPIHKNNYLERPITLGLFGLCLVFLAACATPELKETRETERLTHAIANLRASRPSLSLDDTPGPTDPHRRFTQHYGLNFPQAAHHFGYVSNGQYDLATHVWRAPKPTRGTVYLLHGYYNHVGLLSPLIRYFLEEGYNIVAFDLPGHGLSSGKRASIPSFEAYQKALTSIFEATKSHLPEPTIWVGHSLGGAVLIRELLQTDNLPKHHVVLLAPLVRSAYWGPSHVAHTLMTPFIDSVPRRFPKVSHDPRYNRFIRHEDPLQHRSFPLEWADALFRFNRAIRNAAPNPEMPVTIIQGTGDTILSWRYNLAFLSKKLPQSTIYRIPKAKHELFHESQPLRRQVFDAINAALLIENAQGKRGSRLGGLRYK